MEAVRSYIRDLMLRAKRGEGVWARAKRTVSAQNSYDEARSRIEQEKAERAQWSEARVRASALVASAPFSWSMSILVLLNLVFVIIEVNHGAKDMDVPDWFAAANLGILAFYMIELCIKIFAFRGQFFADPFGVLDFCVVAVDVIVSIIIIVMPVSLLPLVLARIARILKVTRALRMLSVFPELNVLMRGLLIASTTIAWGVVMLSLCLCFWGIFATLFIHPIVQDLQQEGYWDRLECERCPRAFESVEMSMLTFCQQLIVGEGWSEINTPLMERHPHTARFFILVMVSLMLAALNLLLGVMVERASEANAATVKELLSKKNRAREEASVELFKMCEALDEDGSGKLTLDELQNGIETNSDFAHTLELMDIDGRDIDIVFSMLDTDCSGDVEYKEFVEQLQVMKSGETHTMLIFIKFYIMEMRASLNRALSAIKLGDAGDDVLFASSGSGTKRPSKMSLRGASTPGGGAAPTSISSSQWPTLDDELQRLTEIRKEVMDFSQRQVGKIDIVHQRLKTTLLGASSPAPTPEGCGNIASSHLVDDGDAWRKVPPSGLQSACCDDQWGKMCSI
eukprot:CAMPEP_0176113696 /NCGR_PEP_ID=MMETSP0120_2-20121206/57096_1 /TAXON_ID=160619 /ORGANISM="Kryptoperidinium foliaceum, Strain CCMP 1326" /LENGTH=568 /DNA_ID=CAMNT_0017447925 /DNA_START=66 /DNA_END=1772 /DNA_ORIENTATION=+